jgi:hypothetical protein
MSKKIEMKGLNEIKSKVFSIVLTKLFGAFSKKFFIAGDLN